MAYTNIWNTNSPLGSQDAKTADDEFRKLRLDLEERLESTLITDVVADPWVARPEILGNVTGKTFIIHHSAFKSVDDDASTLHEIERTALYSQHNSAIASTTWWAPVILPDGVTVTNVQFVVNRNGSTDINCRLNYNTFSTAPATTIVGSVSTNANGILLLALSSGVPHLRAVDRTYFLEIFIPTSQQVRVYGAKITYSTPDCRSTL